MDLNLYYILPRHNPAAISIMAYGSMVCLAWTIAGFALQRIKKNRMLWYTAGSAWLMLWAYVAMTFTIFGRYKSEEAQIEMRLFWCIKVAWQNRDVLYWYLIVGNILLFVPLGMILFCFFERLRSWWKISLCGLITSLLIEVMQLILHLGLFELDDLLHNTLGTYLGFCLCSIVYFVIKKDGRQNRKSSFVMSCVSWGLVIAFWSTAAFMGQPVFEWLRV